MLLMKTKLSIVLLLWCGSLLCEQNFSSFQNLLLHLPENIQSINDDWERVDYGPYYKNRYQRSFDTLLKNMGILKDDGLSIEHIEAALQNILKLRWFYASQQEDSKRGQFWCGHLVVKSGTKFILWGDLFGGVQSLMRDFEYLQGQGIIDTSLKIVKPGYYFIFLGNTINRSPYSLEMLFFICSLMQQNPDRVIYIRGKHENYEIWKNFNLSRQIAASYHNNSKKIARLETMIDNFFISLPIGMFITQHDSTRNIICLSNEIPNYYLDPLTFNNFFFHDQKESANVTAQNEDLITFVPVTHTESEQMPYTVIIKGKNTLKTSFYEQPLTLELPSNNATVWSILSGPTWLYQKFAHFYQDAFVQLTMHEKITNATLQLFSQDVRNKQGFKAGSLLDIITGQKIYDYSSQPASPYLVGSTMPLSKGGFFMGLPVREALYALLNQSNEENLLNNHFVKAIVLDDHYEANRAAENVKKLIKDYAIEAMLLPVGSPSLVGYIQLVKSGEVSVFFPVTGSTLFRKSEYKHLIHWRPSYDDEARILIEHITSKKHFKKIAFFYQNDAYGQGPLAQAHEILKQKGIAWVDVPYGANDRDFTAAIAAIRQARPDAIGFFSIPAPTKRLLDEIGPLELLGKTLFAISGLEDVALRQYLADRGITMSFSEVVPNPAQSTLEIVKDYRALMDSQNLTYDVFGLEAYIGTRLYLDALKNIKDEVTMGKLIHYFEGFNNITYKGLRMNFDPATRCLSHAIWIREDDENWKEFVVPQKSVVAK